MTAPTIAKQGPCGSCPYRRDVPSGVWHPSEYDKLLRYDGQTWEQSVALFYCHQQDGHLCAGWAACHDTDHLLALRMNEVAPEVYGYKSPVPVFGSGAEARAHGLADVEEPSFRAEKTIAGLLKKRGRTAREASR